MPISNVSNDCCILQSRLPFGRLTLRPSRVVVVVVDSSPRLRCLRPYLNLHGQSYLKQLAGPYLENQAGPRKRKTGHGNKPPPEPNIPRLCSIRRPRSAPWPQRCGDPPPPPAAPAGGRASTGGCPPYSTWAAAPGRTPRRSRRPRSGAARGRPWARLSPSLSGPAVAQVGRKNTWDEGWDRLAGGAERNTTH